MAMTLRNERVGDCTVPLPSEVVSVIGTIVKKRPSSEVTAIVSEVIESLAGSDPDKLLAWIKSCGTPGEFIKAIQDETRRAKKEARESFEKS